ncbi:MAG TPA: hypothetical protein PLH79_09685 [bacterium]|nr:hypothetical protein [Candidatus Omnitrophota bacterium]HOL94606.1 hypothetical protein [bacterium]HPP01366.1 hypothetical protein [bacterium]HXK94476.1 hypothetical protein [bacterium]
MKREELEQAILELPPEEKIRLMKDIGPVLCDTLMSRPGAMEEMMPLCRKIMADRPKMMARMREMMKEPPTEE